MARKFCTHGLTAERLREFVSYDPTTGQFTRCGKPSGNVSGGYLKIRIDRHSFLAHRLAWLYVHGEWPVHMVDHIDGDCLNNAISNLREASEFENQQNHKRRGYYFDARKGLFYSYIKVNKTRHYVGSYRSSDEARSAYLAATLKFFGEFSPSSSRGIS